MRRPIHERELLKERLDQLALSFDASSLSPDPLELVIRYESPLDQEVAGLIASSFAYGRADLIVRNVGRVLDEMGSPFEFLSGPYDHARAARLFRGFTHRLHKAPDLLALLARISAALHRHGSLGTLFRNSYSDQDPDVGPSLARFVDTIVHSVEGPPRSMRYLLSSPEDGSACKRMNLYLRWMVRKESPDLGLWTFVDASKLLMPVDTHVHRITTFLGLNERKSADWKTARAITDRLLEIDPRDPVRYDFAICRLGVLDQCSRRRRKELCDVCLLNDVCRFRLTD